MINRKMAGGRESCAAIARPGSGKRPWRDLCPKGAKRPYVHRHNNRDGLKPGIEVAPQALQSEIKDTPQAC
ncbi:hypothetical protein [Kroppenstedtia sanguinis]|uniref:Uncharacterized protein n=1 Tax=Kroppenstedtia sanguinis TaxID=1380684 RepID=A0ABW4C673_9BACL